MTTATPHWDTFKRTKLRLFKAATHCAICGALLAPREDSPTHPLARTIDHIKPKCKGGTNDLANLRVVHRKCNMERGDGTKETVRELRQRVRALEYQLRQMRRFNREEPE